MHKLKLRCISLISLVSALLLFAAAPGFAVSQTELKTALRNTLNYDLPAVMPYADELTRGQALQNSFEAVGLRFELQLFDRLFMIPELQLEDSVFEVAKRISPSVPADFLQDMTAPLSAEDLALLTDWAAKCKNGMTLRANFPHPNGTELRILRRNIGKPGELINTGSLSERPLFAVSLLLDPKQYRGVIATTEGFGEPKAELSRIAAEYYGCIAAVNGGYFFNSNKSVGVLKNDGVFENVSAWPNRSAVCWNAWGNVLFIDGQDIGILTNDTTLNFSEALQAGPMLLRDGVKCTATDNIDLKVLNMRHPRTVFGMSGDRIMLTVIDGRNPLHSVGTTIQETKNVCLELGMQTALNLDGGGSSALWWLGGLVNLPSEKGVERKIPYGIVYGAGE